MSMSQHITSILLYPTAVAYYACDTALVSISSLLDNKWGASRLLDVPLKGFLILHVSLQVDREFLSSKVKTKLDLFSPCIIY